MHSRLHTVIRLAFVITSVLALPDASFAQVKVIVSGGFSAAYREIAVTITARGAESTAMVATGDAELAIQPVSELLRVPGVDFVGTIPQELQYVSVFTAAVVAGSKEADASRRLTAFLSSEAATAAIKKSGMEPSRRR